jgi:hypothetical protein
MAAKKQPPSNDTTGTSVPANSSVNPANYQAAGNPLPMGGSYATNSNTGVSENFIPKGMGKSGITDNGTTTAFYNLSTYPRELLASYGTDEVARKTFLKTLYERGWYKGDDKPGGGLSDEDETAVYRLMYASNLTGVPWNKVLTSVSQSPFVSASGKGAGFRPSSTEDLVEIANRTALSSIGRKLTAEESAKFARSYQSSQQSEASGGMSAPTTEVFFKNRIEQKYGAESDGYKYVSAISNVARLMENM